MAERFEMIRATDAKATWIRPGTTIGVDELTETGLMLGDSETTALVIQGSLQELREFVMRIQAALGFLEKTQGFDCRHCKQSHPVPQRFIVRCDCGTGEPHLPCPTVKQN